VSEPTPKPTMQTLVRHGLEILTQGIAQRAGIKAEHVKPIAESSIDRFVRENVSDKPLSLEGVCEDLGILRRNPRRLKK